MENELQQEKKCRFICLILFIIVIIILIIIILIITGYYLIPLYKKYNECDANEKNHTTVITTLDSRLKYCIKSSEKEEKMCKEGIREIKTQKDRLNTELEKVQKNSADCSAQLKYCKLHYLHCQEQLQKEETKRENLEKTFNNATLECSKARKICEIDIQSINNKLGDCEIRAKDKEKCQEDLHECNRKTCYII